MFEVKTRFRFSSEGGVGGENAFRGREVRDRYPLSPITQTIFLPLPHHINLFA